MRIGINAFFLGQPATGSGQYTRHLLEALARVEPANEYLLLSPSSVPRTCNLQLAACNLSENLAKLWFEQVSFPRACRRLDLAHVPYFASPLFPTTPTVVTIHDLIPLILPVYRGSLLVRAYTRLVAKAAKRADAVIADSQASKRDIVRLLGIPFDRVQVVYLAAEEKFRPVKDKALLEAMRRKYGLPDHYILYLGGFDCRKNVAALVQAFTHLRICGSADLKLVIAGRLPERDTALFPDPRRLTEELGIGERVVFTGWVAEEDKPAIYSGAAAFAFLSLYEGFGLPPLEAMACGVPVIASDRASLPEVVGEGGLLVDPTDVDSLAAAMGRLLTDDSLRAELRGKALAQAAKFSWEKTARETLAVYQKVVA